MGGSLVMLLLGATFFSAAAFEVSIPWTAGTDMSITYELGACTATVKSEVVTLHGSRIAVDYTVWPMHKIIAAPIFRASCMIATEEPTISHFNSDNCVRWAKYPVHSQPCADAQHCECFYAVNSKSQGNFRFFIPQEKVFTQCQFAFDMRCEESKSPYDEAHGVASGCERRDVIRTFESKDTDTKVTHVTTVGTDKKRNETKTNQMSHEVSNLVLKENMHSIKGKIWYKAEASASLGSVLKVGGGYELEAHGNKEWGQKSNEFTESRDFKRHSYTNALTLTSEEKQYYEATVRTGQKFTVNQSSLLCSGEYIRGIYSKVTCEGEECGTQCNGSHQLGAWIGLLLAMVIGVMQ